MKTFSDKVRDIVRKIPNGKTMTYKAVAAKAGNPKAARAVCAATFVRAVGPLLVALIPDGPDPQKKPRRHPLNSLAFSS
jgi:6-O-methylguanine DNA methyltransferase, DNA binding domain